MNFFYAIIFGAVQGITEFLPISSSGHLAVLHDFFHFELADDLSFDVALHWGTLLALVIFFWRDIWILTKGFFRWLTNFDLKNNFEARLSWLIVFGTIPAGVVGYFFGDWLEATFRSTSSIAFMLIVVGLLFFLLEKYSRREREMGELNWLDAVVIGIAQSVALIPGVSRSGITIIAGLGRKLKRETAARFSFIMSIPAVLGAGIKKFHDLSGAGVAIDWGVWIVGVLTAAVVGYFCLKYFLKFLSKHSLQVFGWYRIILGLAILIYLLA